MVYFELHIRNMTSFKDLINFDAKHLFKKEDTSMLGIDIGATAIKVVQLRKEKGVAVLETYGELSLGPYSNKEIGQAVSPTNNQVASALTDLLREANTTTKNCGFSIPFSSSLISLIDMPKLSEEQLAKVIPIEARKYIPVPISEVTLDWFIIPEEEKDIESFESGEADKVAAGKEKQKVLVVAIHNDILSNYREIVDLTNLDASFFEIEIFATIRAVIGRNLSPTMILDIGAGTTKLFIVEYGVVKLSHVINRGSQDITRTISQSLGLSLTKAEEFKREYGVSHESSDPSVTEAMLLPLGDIFGDVNRVLLSYEKKSNKNIGTVVLTGGGAVLKGLLSFAKERLRTDVVLGNPFEKVEAPAFLEDVLKEVGPEFSVAVGLALRKLQEIE